MEVLQTPRGERGVVLDMASIARSHLVNPCDKEKMVPTLNGSCRTAATKVMSWWDWSNVITLA